MKLRTERPYFILFFISFLILFTTIAYSQNLQQIKAQMLERKPTIDALKNQGIVGEGADGYLHLRQQSSQAQQIITAENADRRTVNATIAKREGTTVEQVSKKVGAKLQQATRPGQWIRKADGSWHKK